MCRWAVIPSNMPKELAEQLALFLERRCGGDGTGVAYLDSNKVIINKTTKKITEASEIIDIKSKEGKVWLFHTRKASIGDRSIENTHPFLCGRWAFAHNGHFGMYKLVKYLLNLKTAGDTDSEVLGQLFARLGPYKFYKYVDNEACVAMSNKYTYIFGDSYNIEVAKTKYGYLFASEIPYSLKEELGYKEILVPRDKILIRIDNKSGKFKTLRGKLEKEKDRIYYYPYRYYSRTYDVYSPQYDPYQDTLFCDFCGSDDIDEMEVDGKKVRRCGSCGAILPTPTDISDNRLFCPNCESCDVDRDIFEDNSYVCLSCGYTFKSTLENSAKPTVDRKRVDKELGTP